MKTTNKQTMNMREKYSIHYYDRDLHEQIQETGLTSMVSAAFEVATVITMCTIEGHPIGYAQNYILYEKDIRNNLHIVLIKKKQFTELHITYKSEHFHFSNNGLFFNNDHIRLLQRHFQNISFFHRNDISVFIFQMQCS